MTAACGSACGCVLICMLVRMVRKPKTQYGEGREALYRATVEIVAERGLRGLTFRAVGDKAGVSNALVAYHFGDREGLLVATLEWSTEIAITQSRLSAAAESSESFENAMHVMALEFRSFLIFQYEMIAEASRNVVFREPVEKLYRSFFDALSPKDDYGSRALTRAQFATLDGLVLQAVSGAITSKEFRESLRVAADWIRQ